MISDSIPRMMLGLCMMLLLLPAPAADPRAQKGDEGRWLLVFDSSSSMKKILPGTEVAVANFFAGSAGGEMKSGDSVAVWSVDQNGVRQFPRFEWDPANQGGITNLVRFLRAQAYSTPSALAGLHPEWGRLATNSRRLTIVIFTDGHGKLLGTPYDDGVNQTFSDVATERAKSRQPVVVVVRGQLGTFAGCALAFPPAEIGLPPFPELPPAAVVRDTNSVRVTNAAVVKPVPSLVLSGRPLLTNLMDAVTNAPSVSAPSNNPAPNPEKPSPPATEPRVHEVSGTSPSKPAPLSNAVAPASITNIGKPVVPPVQAVASSSQPGVPLPSPVSNLTASTTNISGAIEKEDSGGGGGRLPLYVASCVGFAVFVLGCVWYLRGFRRGGSSLISRSLDDETRGR